MATYFSVVLLHDRNNDGLGAFDDLSHHSRRRRRRPRHVVAEKSDDLSASRRTETSKLGEKCVLLVNGNRSKGCQNYNSDYHLRRIPFPALTTN